jgi:uncharacterized protein YjbI with pentapeptide repeats
LRRLPLLLALAVLLVATAARAQSPPSPGVAATRPFVGVWAATGDGRRFDVHHAGPFLLWVTPSDGSWAGSAFVLAGVRGPPAAGRFVVSGDGSVRLTLPAANGVAPVVDAVVRRVAERPPPDVSLAAALCDPRVLGIARPGLRRIDLTGGGRGIGPRADLRDAILTGLDLRGVDLTGADLSGAVLCGVDLSGARLAGARLDGAVLASAFDGSTASLAAADLTGASMVGARIGGMDQTGAVFDRADLRDAVVGCTPGMVAEGCGFPDMTGVSLAGADLRGAHAPVWGGVARSGEGTRLDGAGFHADARTVAWLAAAGLADAERVMLHPVAPLRRGRPQAFTGAEIRALAPLLPPTRAHPEPGFDCRAARLPAERGICTTPALAARDRAMATLWRSAARSDAERTAQRAWLARRNACAADGRCLADVYGERLVRLARDTPTAPGPAGTLVFSPEPPVHRPDGSSGALVDRWAQAWGDIEDRIAITVDAGGGTTVRGASMGSNGHGCEVDGEPPTVVGRLVTVTPDGWEADEETAGGLSPLSFVMADDVLVVTRQGLLFCGARAMWSEVYFLRR